MMDDNQFRIAVDEMTEVLRVDTAAALASIAQSRALAERMGFDLPRPSFGSGKRGPEVSATKGKSKPNLAGWLRRALEDGTLPVPNDILIVSERMVQQGLDAGYIMGTGHPYRATTAGLHYAVANFKGSLIAK
jgi:hypothetical protein